jgi:hypothetical protein
MRKRRTIDEIDDEMHRVITERMEADWAEDCRLWFRWQLLKMTVALYTLVAVVAVIRFL